MNAGVMEEQSQINQPTSEDMSQGLDDGNVKPEQIVGMVYIRDANRLVFFIPHATYESIFNGINPEVGLTCIFKELRIHFKANPFLNLITPRLTLGETCYLVPVPDVFILSEREIFRIFSKGGAIGIPCSWER